MTEQFILEGAIGFMLVGVFIYGAYYVIKTGLAEIGRRPNERREK